MSDIPQIKEKYEKSVIQMLISPSYFFFIKVLSTIKDFQYVKKKSILLCKIQYGKQLTGIERRRD